MVLWLFLSKVGASLISQLVKNLPAMHETLVRFLGWEDALEKGMATHSVFLGFPVAQLVKNPPTMRETWVGSLDWEDPLEKGMTIHSQYSGLEFSTDYSPWVTKSRTQLSNFHFWVS